MAKEQRGGPVQSLRALALTLERLAAREAVSGAVSGVAEGLRKEAPELDGQLRTLLQDLLTVLGRLAHEAAEREHLSPSDTAQAMAGAAMQGALDVLEREWQDGGMPLQAFVERLNRVLDGVMEFAFSRADEIRAPGDRAAEMTRGVMKAAVEQLNDSLPVFADEARKLIPYGEEVAEKVGRGVVAGMGSRLQEDSDALVGLLERAGRGLVRGLAAGLREELASTSLPSAEAMGARLESLAERTAAATVRGAGGALEAQGRRFRDALRRDGALRGLGRELTGGVLEALSAGLRKPLVAAAGAGSALVALSVLAVRWRTA